MTTITTTSTDLALPDLASKINEHHAAAEAANAGGNERTPRTYADLEALLEAAEPWQPPEGTEGNTGGKSRPEVLLGTDEARIAKEVVDALGDWEPTSDPASRVFQRQGRLVQLIRSPTVEIPGMMLPDGALRIRPIPRPIIRECIGEAVLLLVESEDGPTVKRPPDWLVNAISERGQFPDCVRYLTGIVRSPTLRPDGTILQEPGHDKATGLLYEPDGQYPPIPESPTRGDATKAAEMLLHAVADFPFAGEEHRSVWLALVLEMAGRPAIAGPTPLTAIDANTPGTGKSLLSDVASLIVYGTPMARKTWPRDDDEVRKTITSIAIEGVPAVLLDNVAATLGSASLDAALTGTTWTDRRLGSNETTGALPLTTVWVATGNNLVLGADTSRRTLYCRLESSEENPEDRQDFRHPDLLGWVRQDRHQLAVAAVTILRAYLAAGKPDQHLVPWGSYEAWSQVVRAPIVWLGLPDHVGTRAAVREADRSAEVLRLLMDGIQEADMGDGVTAADIIRLLDHPVDEDSQDPYPTLRAAVAEACDKATARKLGYQLRKYAGRVCGGRRLSKRPGHGGVKVWFVESIGCDVILRGCDGGNGGDETPAAEKTEHEQKNTVNRKKGRGGETSPPSPPSPPAGNGDLCPDCLVPLTHTPTADGYVNRDCPKCGKVFTCVKAGDQNS